MKRFVLFGLFLVFCLFSLGELVAQTYYYDGGSISMNDLRRARPYKKGTFALQGNKKGIIWIPKYDARGQHYLELMLEHFLQGSEEIRDYSGVQIGALVCGSHGTASVLALLMDLEAREMLGVSKEQGEKINQIFVEFRKQIANRLTEFQQRNPRATQLETVLVRTSEIERLSMPLASNLNAVLSDKQIQQAKEMVFQLYNGFDTPVVDLGILSLFDLTREQRNELELLGEDANSRRDKVFRDNMVNRARYGDSEYQATDSALRGVSEFVGRKIRAVLTSAQLKKGDDLMAGAEEIKNKLGLTKD